MLWLGVIATDLYKREIGHLIGNETNFAVIGFFYLIFISGLDYFVIKPNLDKLEILKVLVPGMIFGFVTYATYQLTSLATIAGWPLKIVVIDILWGAIITSITAGVTYLVINLKKLI